MSRTNRPGPPGTGRYDSGGSFHASEPGAAPGQIGTTLGSAAYKAVDRRSKKRAEMIFIAGEFSTKLWCQITWPPDHPITRFFDSAHRNGEIAFFARSIETKRLRIINITTTVRKEVIHRA